MAIANTVQSFLKQHHVKPHLVPHPHSGSSMETAEQAHVSGDALAKGVVVKTADGVHLMVVLPSDYHVEMAALGKLLGRRVTLATEDELAALFPDCEAGAVPPLGEAYGLQTIWDPNTSLGKLDKVFFEAGDHENLVSVSGRRFHELLAHAERGEFSRHL